MKKFTKVIVFFMIFLMFSIPYFTISRRGDSYFIKDSEIRFITKGNMINITTPENKLYTEPMSGYYPASYGFENDEDDSIPYGWEDYTDGAFGDYIKVISRTFGHNKTVEAYHPVPLDPAFIWDLRNNFNNTEGSIEFWWAISSVSGSACINVEIYDSSDNVKFGVCVVNGQIQVDDAGGWSNVPGLTTTANTWDHVRLDFRSASGNSYEGLNPNQFKLYYNGVDKGTFSFYGNGDPAYIRLYPDWWGNPFYGYFDAFGYSWDPKYSVGDNLNEGLLLSFVNGTALDWMGYSLDGLANKTIFGNTTFWMPQKGNHSIQVFGNDSIGNMYESEIRYFQIYGPNSWNLTGSPIFVDDSDPNFDWIKTAMYNGWCYGSGTLNDPYIIENVTIDGLDSGNCIEIRNSRKHFIIRNCTLYNSELDYSYTHAGIKLVNTSFGKILDNNCSLNGENGIFLTDNCNNNTIFRNNVTANRETGIRITNNCNYNNITQNNASNTLWGSGMIFYQSHNNTISGNIVNANQDGSGIGLSNCNDNNILGNNITHNGRYWIHNGLDLDQCHYNIISNNTVYDCSGSGIRVDGSNNSITRNNVSLVEHGIELSGGNNTALENKMVECGFYISHYLGLQALTSLTIDTTNKVNEKPVYFYANELNLGFSNFSSAGQVILVNCSDSTISNLNISHTSIGLQLFYCDLNTISDNNFSFNIEAGMDCYYSNNNNISGNIAYNNSYAGISIYYFDNCSISGNIIYNNSGSGITMYAFSNNTIIGNTVFNNMYGIDGDSGSDNNITGNIVENNTDGMSFGTFSSFSNNRVYKNNVSGNSGTGMIIENGDYNNISYNDLIYNGIGLIVTSDNSNISRNNASNNINDGIYVSGENCTILGNIAFKNGYGIGLTAINCNLSGNIVINNTWIGFYLSDCYDNIIMGNNVTGNGNYGFYCYYSTNNNITNNIVTNSTEGIYTTFSDDFIIKDNVVANNSAYGIRVVQGNNFIIFNNTVENNQDGICLYMGNSFTTCINNNITKNTVTDNTRGIYINMRGSSSHYDYNNIIENTLYNNDYGIYLLTHGSHGSSDHNSIIRNNVTDSTYGIYLHSDWFNTACNDNEIIQNSIENNTYGIYLNGDLGICDYNTIIDNDIVNNSYGIYLQNSKNNNFTENIITDNIICGINITDPASQNNLFYENYFIGNGLHAFDNGSVGSNHWNSSMIGNSWANYTGADANDDCIGDFPYIFIAGNAGSQDFLPIFDDGHDGTKIHVDDTGINSFDWAWSSKFSWISGSGTLIDPYVIENLIINASGSGIGILIENSNSYFIIRNCSLYNAGSSDADAAIKLINTINGTLFNNTCSNNGYAGIYCVNCNDTIISENTVNNNEEIGICLEFCNNNNISRNYVNYNAIGLFFSDSNSNNVSGNILGGNQLCIFEFQCVDNKFENNTCLAELFIAIENQSFSNEEFIFTFFVYNQTNHGIDDATILMWWDGSNVTDDVINLGSGFYSVTLTPITVASGEDPILLNMTISANGYLDKYYEIENDYLGDEIQPRNDRLPNAIIIAGILVAAAIIIFGLLQRSRPKAPPPKPPKKTPTPPKKASSDSEKPPKKKPAPPKKVSANSEKPPKED